MLLKFIIFQKHIYVQFCNGRTQSILFISLILAAIGWRSAVSFVKFAIVMDLRLIKRAEKLLSLDLAELTLALLQAALV